jgi:hypothetical protein
MFTLTSKEVANLRCQIGTSSWGGKRYIPMVFTEQGVAMLSSVLRSSTAIQVNINIIRVFTKLREYALTHKDILMKLVQLGKEVNLNNRKTETNTQDILNIFSVLKELVAKEAKPAPRKRIGFRRNNELD